MNLISVIARNSYDEAIPPEFGIASPSERSRNDKKVSGFTLIELLIVISIIGVLAALVLANFNTARERARDTQRKSDFNEIKKALRLYYNDQSPTQYPDSDLIVWGSTFQSGNNVYMKQIPHDPSYDSVTETPEYNYRLALVGGNPNNQDFCLWTALENASDPEGLRSRTKCSVACTGVAWGDINYYAACAD